MRPPVRDGGAVKRYVHASDVGRGLDVDMID